ncbi:hypothetical protein K491DRAFT_775194 [Lophiostoma macrostomum CBS 122681]|uniref:Uncharacterized protein n=1 Tax=Lophiostoma macrostomum CBS 122681 TaxID=1314788 RepID=A0A6A6TJN2_9PLEO|nr:hypothetical protein K491DRAFT_775194 [Lophiostoma macrostomum CBS 122681]
METFKTLRERIEDLEARAKEGNDEAQQRLRTIGTRLPTSAQLESRVKYAFQPASRQNDDVIAIMIQLIRDLRQKYMHMAHALYIKVMPTTNDTPIYPPELYPGRRAKFYTFDDGTDIPRTVSISIIPYEYPLTADKLQVKLAKTRIPLIQWLLKLPKWPIVGEEGIVA